MSSQEVGINTGNESIELHMILSLLDGCPTNSFSYLEYKHHMKHIETLDIFDLSSKKTHRHIWIVTPCCVCDLVFFHISGPFTCIDKIVAGQPAPLPK